MPQVTGIPKHLHGHKLVVSTAVEMAHALYERLMSDNLWYNRWKSQNAGASALALERRFVLRTAPGLFVEARSTLAQMLRQPIEQSLKDDIQEALILDAQIRKRAHAMSLN